MAYIDTLAAAVRGLTTDWREQAAMLMACGAESGCAPVQNRQGAPAYGPWQIYLPYHPSVTIAQANDPTYAAEYMYRNMNVRSCVAHQDTWSSDPQGAAIAAARCIEGATPLEPYSGAQTAAGWQIVQQYAPPPGSQNPNQTPTGQTLGFPVPQIPGITGPGGILGGLGSGIASGAGQAAGGAVLSWAGDLLKAILAGDWPQRLLLIGSGWILAVMGVSALVKSEIPAGAVQAAAAA